jgi:hypothetical protein
MRAIDKNKDEAAAISAAIRERIRALEDELAHWRKMLLECEGGRDALPHACSGPGARRTRCAG